MTANVRFQMLVMPGKQKATAASLPFDLHSLPKPTPVFLAFLAFRIQFYLPRFVNFRNGLI